MIFPVKAAFGIGLGYLDSARRHPIGVAAAAAVADYAKGLTTISGRAIGNDALRDRVRSQFAELIGARPDEIAMVQSTIAAENLILQALGLPNAEAGIVTDIHHYGGSLYMYEALRRQGFPVVILGQQGQAVTIDDYARAIVPGTRLVAVSLVSASTGHVSDLAAITAMAHERGALVYADIIQAAGAIPIDVMTSGVDFCAASTYKWLMGDMGGGLLYVRADRLEGLRRPVYGSQQLVDRIAIRGATSAFPRPGGEQWGHHHGARALFEMETTCMSALVAVSVSLDFLREVGIVRAHAHRRQLIERARDALQSGGFDVITPDVADTPILAVRLPQARNRLAAPLEDLGITISLYDDHFRISPSLFNDREDIDFLAEALTRSVVPQKIWSDMA